MQDNNYIVAIISYKRAKNLLTYDTLRNQGFTGKIYIFVSDNDPELSEYKRLYDNVVIFNKKVIYESMNMDLYDNFYQLNNGSIVRNAVIKYARQYNIPNIVILDDDIRGFYYRYQENKKLLSKSITSIKLIFDTFIEYLQVSDKLKCLSFGYPGVYIGGLNGKFTNGYQRLISQVYFMKVDDTIHFNGTRNEDEIFSITNNFLAMSLFMIQQNSVERMQDSGGLSEDYKKYNLYTCSYYTVIHNPSGSKINWDNGRYLFYKLG